MQLEAQKSLLKELADAEKAALRLYNGGEKIGGIVLKIRAAVAELESRIRFIEKNAPKPAARPAFKKVPVPADN